MKIVHQTEKFDKEIVEEYLEKFPETFCPYCRSTNFENTGTSGGTRDQFSDYKCKDCNKRWVEYYETILTKEEHRDVLMKLRDSEKWDLQTFERIRKSWKLKNIYPDEHHDDDSLIVVNTSD